MLAGVTGWWGRRFRLTMQESLLKRLWDLNWNLKDLKSLSCEELAKSVPGMATAKTKGLRQERKGETVLPMKVGREKVRDGVGRKGRDISGKESWVVQGQGVRFYSEWNKSRMRWDVLFYLSSKIWKNGRRIGISHTEGAKALQGMGVDLLHHHAS